MKILLKKVVIADPVSPHFNTVKDILISGDIIEKIDFEIDDADEVIQLENVAVSPGWVDIFSDFSDPGFEYKETLESGAAAASAGGYTQVFTLPNTYPVSDNKSQIDYVIQKAKYLPVAIHPLGAITRQCGEKELAEMVDMHYSGAIAFTNGLKPLQSTALMVKALQYIKAFDGIIIQMPVDNSFGGYGLMHEGIISTQLGLPGIPALAEELMVERDIQLAQYADSRLHLTGISTAKSVECIKEAKNSGLDITCSVTPYHLFFCDEDLGNYDTNLKVNPPLRSRNDIMELRKAVKEGLVDCIATHHIPQNRDDKTCEFEYAKNGMTGLQTAFSTVITAIPDLSLEKIVSLFSLNASKIFKLPRPVIKEGETAELTLFSTDESFLLTKENGLSKSYNSPFINKELSGKVAAVFSKGRLILNK